MAWETAPAKLLTELQRHPGAVRVGYCESQRGTLMVLFRYELGVEVHEPAATATGRQVQIRDATNLIRGRPMELVNPVELAYGGCRPRRDKIWWADFDALIETLDIQDQISAIDSLGI